MCTQQKLSALTLALFGLSIAFPFTVAAATLPHVSAFDTVVGLGGEITFGGYDPNTNVDFTIQNPGDSVSNHQITTNGQGAATFSIATQNTILAGLYTVIASGVSTTFSALADRPDANESTLVADKNSIPPNGTVTVTAIVRDRYGNKVTGRPMALVSSRTSDKILNAAQTDQFGRAVWQVQATNPGQMVLSPFDVISGRQLTLSTTVSVGGSIYAASLGVGQSDDQFFQADIGGTTPDHIEITLPDGGDFVPANELFTAKVTIKDENNATVRSYVGSLAVESPTDPTAILPKIGEDPRTPLVGRIDMPEGVQGVRTIALAFRLAPGKQTIVMYDKNNPSLRGELTLRVGTKGGNTDSGIQIVQPVSGTKIASHTVELSFKGPTFVDFVIDGGLQSVETSTDAEGVGRATINLAPTVGEATIFVNSKNGTLKTMAHYIIDTIAPVIGAITIDPAEGKTKDPATLTVVSEAELSEMTARIDGVDTPLLPRSEKPTEYTGTLTAPATPGTYDIAIQAKDSVGNVSAVTVLKWKVGTKEIPVVLNVKAQGQAMQVALSWNAMAGIEVKEYKIYVAKASDPTNYFVSFGTKKPVTSAIIKDLVLGEEYEFSLTAIDVSGSESTEKSAPASASPLGMNITITPGNQSMLLEWVPIADLPLSHYILEFGTEPGVFTERKTVNGEAVSLMLRDLLSGVEYFVRLIPIAVNGQTRADLSALAQGTPTGKGFIAGTSEAVPPDTFTDLHAGAPLKPRVIPTVPRTGIPTSLFFSMVALSLLFLGWYIRRVGTERKKTQAFLSMMQNRYHA